GEWGHNALPWPQPEELPGPACYCGRRGCLETWLSGPALAREAAARVGGAGRGEGGSGAGAGGAGAPAGDAAAVVRHAQAGDADAQAALTAWFDRLARGLAM